MTIEDFMGALAIAVIVAFLIVVAGAAWVLVVCMFGSFAFVATVATAIIEVCVYINQRFRLMAGGRK